MAEGQQNMVSGREHATDPNAGRAVSFTSRICFFFNTSVTFLGPHVLVQLFNELVFGLHGFYHLRQDGTIKIPLA